MFLVKWCQRPNFFFFKLLVKKEISLLFFICVNRLINIGNVDGQNENLTEKKKTVQLKK